MGKGGLSKKISFLEWENRNFGKFADGSPELFVEEAIVAVFALIVLSALTYFVLFPLLMIVFDLLVVILLFVSGILLRVLFRRPWDIVAECENGGNMKRSVMGWKASKAEMRKLVSEIESGVY